MSFTIDNPNGNIVNRNYHYNKESSCYLDANYMFIRHETTEEKILKELKAIRKLLQNKKIQTKIKKNK